jgi:hypothetical protein
MVRFLASLGLAAFLAAAFLGAAFLAGCFDEDRGAMFLFYFLDFFLLI